MRGTSKAYEALLNSVNKPNVDTLYFIYDADASKAKLYLGEKLIAGGGEGGPLSLGDLTNVTLTDLRDKSVLVYDKDQGQWVNSTLEKAISVFAGATDSTAGIAGLVPAPEAGQTNLYLRSDGTWAPVTANEAYITTIENEDSSAMHQDILDNATQGVVLAPGDIVIIKDIIAGDKYHHTGYVYTGSAWAAMDGNYNAENVYFDEDFVFTESVGTVTIPAAGSTVVEATGKNIKEFLASIFAQEINPTATLPSISFTSPSFDNSLEVGSYFTPSYTLVFDPGAYTYDESTGVNATAWNVTDSKGRKLSTRSGSFEEIQMVDNSTYTISATANYSDGKVPLTNLGNLCSGAQIVAGETASVTSKKWTGFRRMFCGPDASMSDMDSDWIRTKLSSPGSGSTSRTITWKAADLVGVKRYIIAIPASSGKKVKTATITSSMNADATADYVLQKDTIKVAGNNDYQSVDYNIWIYEPASIASTEVHKVEIG